MMKMHKEKFHVVVLIGIFIFLFSLIPSFHVVNPFSYLPLLKTIAEKIICKINISEFTSKLTQYCRGIRNKGWASTIGINGCLQFVIAVVM
jgi:hypothetical protein